MGASVPNRKREEEKSTKRLHCGAAGLPVRKQS